MCGRYALALRPSEVRRELERARMPVDEAPDDDSSARQSYNFAPGYHGLVYRADSARADQEAGAEGAEGGSTRYRLQAMKWGLIPFWTKRTPDYGSALKTINCRADSLVEDRGMWTTMKRKKRCIVVAQGFYEWLKKGKDKIPHYTQRRDGQMMCFAGLWDCATDAGQSTYTYTIITTDSNKQLSFLHDRMPVILENGSDAIRTWLDPRRTEWSDALQALLKPFDGELECYPVSKDVGKVGNNSPSFVIPVSSAANRNNIANFFAKRDLEDSTAGLKMEHDVNETRETTFQAEGTEDNAPLPIPATEPSRGIKRERDAAEDGGDTADGAPRPKRTNRPGAPMQSPAARPSPAESPSPAKSLSTSPANKATTRSATRNGGAASKAKGSPAKGDGSRKITSFFGRQG